LPLSYEPGCWCLATSMPHALLQDREQGLAEAAGEGARSLALFVSQV